MVSKMEKKRRRRNSIKKFQKANFDFAKYVKNFFVEDGKAYISIKVESINDIISKYSIDEYEWLNSELAAYIEENAYYIPVHYPIVLEIYGYNFTEKDQEMIRKVIKDYFGLKLGDKMIDQNINKKKATVLFSLGLTALVISFILSSIHMVSMIIEVVIIIAWFSIWEFVDFSWLERADFKRQRLEAGQLASLTVLFKS